MSYTQIAGMHAPDCAGWVLALKADLLMGVAEIVTALTGLQAQVSHNNFNRALPTTDEPPALTIIVETTSSKICPHKVFISLRAAPKFKTVPRHIFPHIGILVICGHTRCFSPPFSF